MRPNGWPLRDPGHSAGRGHRPVAALALSVGCDQESGGDDGCSSTTAMTANITAQIARAGLASSTGYLCIARYRQAAAAASGSSMTAKVHRVRAGGNVSSVT